MQNKSKSTTARLPQALLDVGYPDFLAPKNATPYETPTAVTFPKFCELVTEEQENLRKKDSATASRSGSQRLFSALIQDPRVLYLEYLENPTKFDDETGELLQALSHGLLAVKDLSPEQLDLLDQATVLYASLSDSRTPLEGTKPPSVPSSSAIEHLTYQEALSDSSVDLEYREDGKHVPVQASFEVPYQEAPPTFWWKK